MRTFQEIFLELLSNTVQISSDAYFALYETAAKIYAKQVAEDVRKRCYCNPLVIWRNEEEIEIILP